MNILICINDSRHLSDSCLNCVGSVNNLPEGLRKTELYLMFSFS